MVLIYAAVRFFPYWAVPLAIVLADIGLYFRRKKSRTQWFFWFTTGLCLLLTLIWFIYRGDMNSDRWLDQFFGR
ncbi:MAG: hypothetical protein AB7P04_10650 [Bacteriovoracia bacterium]